MRQDISLAILKIEFSFHNCDKYKAREILADINPSGHVTHVLVWDDKPQVFMESTLRGKPLDVEFIEEIDFFYGMKIDTVEQYRKDYITLDHDTWQEHQVNWYPVEVQLGEEPYYYDMVLINGEFWTFAPNLPEILEMAIF